MKLPFTNELGVSTDVSEQVSGPSTRVILHSVESSLFLGAKTGADPGLTVVGCWSG